MKKTFLKRKRMRTVLAGFVIFNIFFAYSLPALAISLNPLKPSAFMDEFEKRYDINRGSVQNLGQNLNVSDLKQNAPEVKVFFNPTDPKEGEKVTAQALPMYFRTTEENLYYTWYLQRKECDIPEDKDSVDVSNSKEKKELCDKDEDGRITPNDWKIEAMSILASDGFDRNEAIVGYDANGNKEFDSSDESGMSDESKDRDGYEADFGGDGTRVEDPHCYVYDFNKGKSYELGDSEQVETISGHSVTVPTLSGEERVAACVRTDEYIDDAGNTTTACANDSQFGSTTDLEAIFNGLGCTASASDNTCSYTFAPDTDYRYGTLPTCESGALSCPSGTTLSYIKKSEAINPFLPSASATCSAYNTSLENSYEAECIAACPDAVGSPGTPDPTCQTACESAGLPAATCSAVTATTEGNLDIEDGMQNGCRHLFPIYNTRFKEYLKNKKVEVPDSSQSDGFRTESWILDLRDQRVGDDNFTHAEEYFWSTNPKEKDTAGTGKPDEANVAGLGQNNFSWAYRLGDKVGVAVEGMSLLPTKYDDASSMIMWALPNNKCEINSSNTTSKTVRIKGYDVTIPVALLNLNNCLKDNLVDPLNENVAKKLDVSIIYSPDNAINDPSGDKTGDTLNFDALINNSSGNSSQFNYKWTMKINKDGSFSNNNWKDITKSLSGGGFVKGGLTEGVGLTSLAVNLNLGAESLGVDKREFNDYFKSGVGYLMANIEVSENVGSLSKDALLNIRKGKAYVIVKIISTDQKVEVYPAEANRGSDGKTELKRSGEEICRGAACFVAKNEIVGLHIENPVKNGQRQFQSFSWTINNNPIICNASMSDECEDNRQTETTFFPVQGSVGDTFTAKLTANDTTTQRNIELVKNFEIIDPRVSFVSKTSDVEAKVLGSYIDLDDKTYADYSETDFTLYSGKKAEFKLSFQPESFEEKSDVEWFVDGTKAKKQSGSDSDVKNSGFTVAFQNDPVQKPIGSVYSLRAKVTYSQPKEIRQALNSIWGISQFDTTEEEIFHNGNVEVIANPSQIAMSGVKGVMAHFASNVSNYTLFLLKVMMSGAIILFVAGMAFSFSPATNREDRYY